MIKNLSLIAFLFLLAFTTHAGSFGFVYQGKAYYQYKDGKKVDDTPFKKNGRAPASTDDDESLILHFAEDEYARCYYWGVKKQQDFKTASKENNIHCFRLSDIKE